MKWVKINIQWAGETSIHSGHDIPTSFFPTDMKNSPFAPKMLRVVSTIILKKSTTRNQQNRAGLQSFTQRSYLYSRLR